MRLPARAHRRAHGPPHARGQVGDLRGEPGGVALQHEQVDLGEHLLHDLRRERLALCPQDLLGGGRPRALVAVEQLLVQLLPRPAPDLLDLDVAVGVEAGELDHRPRQLDDPHRLAHVEHQHLRPLRADAAALGARASRRG